jgi:hypothetical protein
VADLARARKSVAGFAVELAGRALASWQAADLTLPTPITTLLWGRQLGKSWCLAVLALWWAFTRPGSLVLVVSGGGELGSRRLLGVVRGLLDAAPVLRGSVVDDQAGVVRLSNGAEVRCVPASEAAVRGWSVDLLLADECQLVSDDLLLGAALPTTAAREGARVVLAGTATVASGAFFDLCRRGEVGDPAVAFSRRVSTLAGGDDPAPWLSASVLAALEASMGARRADAELRCVWQSGADALFGRAALDRVTADYRPLDLEDGRGDARHLGGVDWGARADRSAVLSVCRMLLPSRERSFAVSCAHRFEAGHPLVTPVSGSPVGVVETIAGSGITFDTLAAERTGMGEGLVPLLARAVRARPAKRGGGVRDAGPVMVETTEDGRERMVRWNGRAFVPARPRDRGGGRALPPTRVVGVDTTQALKQAGYTSLRLLIEGGRLLLPASAADLRRELLMLRVELTAAGGERVGAPGTAVDDLADALMLATYPYRGRDGEWRTLLARAADPAYRLPEPAVDGLATAPTVRTGGGVEVPADPAWVSVGGSLLTLPAGLSERGPVDSTLQEARELIAAGDTTNEKGVGHAG